MSLRRRRADRDDQICLAQAQLSLHRGIWPELRNVHIFLETWIPQNLLSSHEPDRFGNELWDEDPIRMQAHSRREFVVENRHDGNPGEPRAQDLAARSVGNRQIDLLPHGHGEKLYGAHDSSQDFQDQVLAPMMPDNLALKPMKAEELADLIGVPRGQDD